MHQDDAALAARLATEAGDLLLGVRAAHDAVAGRDALGEAADRSAHDFLADALATACPDDAILSEEAADDPARLGADRVWIIDPLDGTREFSEGRDDWAVHVALWERGALVAGAVALPGRGLTLSTQPPPPLPSRPVVAGPWRIAVSRSRPPALADHVARELPGRLLPMGSAGYKAAAVVLGEADAYLHAGGQFEWDSAAPVAVARSAGLHTSRIDGSPVRYNAANPFLPDLLICRPELADDLLTVCAGFDSDPDPEAPRTTHDDARLQAHPDRDARGRVDSHLP